MNNFVNLSKGTDKPEGLNGLGDISKEAFISSNKTSENKDNRLIITDKQLVERAEYFEYLKGWFAGTGLFDVYNTSEKVTSILGFKDIFDIGFKGEQMTHAVVACYDLQTAQSFINRCANGKFSDPAMLFAFYRFNKSDRAIASRCNIELIGINEMIDINDAILSVFGGMNTGVQATVFGRLLRELSVKYRSANNIFRDDIGSLGSEMQSACADGVAQLKESILSAFNEIGLTSLIKKLSGNNSDDNKKAFGEQFKSSSFGELNSANVDLHTTIAPNAYKENVIDNASDFLKITENDGTTGKSEVL